MSDETERDAARYRFLRDNPRVRIHIVDPEDDTLEWVYRAKDPKEWEAIFTDECIA